MLSRPTSRWVGFCSMWLLAAALLAGCGGEETPTPTAVPTVTPTVTPTAVPTVPESPLGAPESPLTAG
ncbi:MAG: hypothetical protein ACKO4U_05780 [Caldilinea sp.]